MVTAHGGNLTEGQKLRGDQENEESSEELEEGEEVGSDQGALLETDRVISLTQKCQGKGGRTCANQAGKALPFVYRPSLGELLPPDPNPEDNK